MKLARMRSGRNVMAFPEKWQRKMVHHEIVYQAQRLIGVSVTYFHRKTDRRCCTYLIHHQAKDTFIRCYPHWFDPGRSAGLNKKQDLCVSEIILCKCNILWNQVPERREFETTMTFPTEGERENAARTELAGVIVITIFSCVHRQVVHKASLFQAFCVKPHRRSKEKHITLTKQS